jgi:hypothetical protein
MTLRVIASMNGIVGVDAAMRALKVGASVVDAVEAGIRCVEANPDDQDTRPDPRSTTEAGQESHEDQARQEEEAAPKTDA